MPNHLRLPEWPNLQHERSLDGIVCGIDEAGCAPLAGPVVAAAVRLPPGPKPRTLRGLTDSKLLTPARRERLFDAILELADVGIGIASVAEIDRLNILNADMLAMRRAVDALDQRPAHALVDGRNCPDLPCAALPLIKGDRRSLSIAAASVVAKVTRDRLMCELADRFPGYGWRQNAGYGSPAHYLGLLRLGPTEHHRRSFAPLSTLFAADAPPLDRYRFAPIRTAPALDGIELLELRRDLHAVFEAGGTHIGTLRRLRGGWTFHAVGYSRAGEPLDGQGPCATFHGQILASPETGPLVRLLASSPDRD